VIESTIEAYTEVSTYYGQGAFYSDGRESIYWSKKANELKEFLKKYN